MIISAQSSYTVAQIEEYLLAEAKRKTGCEGLQQVTIIPRAKGDWIVGPIKTGTADPAHCRAVLSKLEHRLRSEMPVRPNERR
jgi:hypothetical protein